jgi:hypothetical protein
MMNFLGIGNLELYRRKQADPTTKFNIQSIDTHISVSRTRENRVWGRVRVGAKKKKYIVQHVINHDPGVLSSALYRSSARFFLHPQSVALEPGSPTATNYPEKLLRTLAMLTRGPEMTLVVSHMSKTLARNSN